MKRGSKKQEKNNTPAPKRSSRMETVDVTYLCGHEGQRREIVNEGIEHQLWWIRRNVKCSGCYDKGE